ASFLKKWRLRCPPVAVSLEEAGDDLFAFVRFPSTQWKALRTTNAIERINGEFRRRVKTQASLPSQDAVLLLLFGLIRSGYIKLRALDGWYDLQRGAESRVNLCPQSSRITLVWHDFSVAAARRQYCGWQLFIV